MEEKTSQEQAQEKNRLAQAKSKKAAAQVAGAAGISATSYAYGQHRASKEVEENTGNDAGDNTSNQENRPDREEEQKWSEEADVTENDRDTTPREETAAEPEPIAHTDEIDFIIETTETVLPDENATADTNGIAADAEPEITDLPEPIFPDSDLIADNELTEPATNTVESDFAPNEIPDDFIGDSIQQDLFA